MNELRAIGDTYSRLISYFEERLEHAQKLGKKADSEWLEKQMLINNSAYFILAWAQLEGSINEICRIAISKRRNSTNWNVRRAWDAHDPKDPRARFEDRAALVLDRQSDAYRILMRYYAQRNQVAHGKNLATGLDISLMIADFYHIIGQLRE